jgi:hypothetical protein
MSLTLDDFVSDTIEELQRFKLWWEKMHAAEPEKYPMEMPDENAGLWFEMYLTYSDVESSGG